MKKTLLYMLLLGILGAGLYIVFNKEEGFSKSDSNFNIKDTASIGKIFLASRDGTTILLERSKDGNGWMLNNEYKALPSTVTSLLSTFYQQEGRHPVPQAIHNTIVKALAGSGVKVEVYDRSGEKMREFYVGGETKALDGSYMLMAGSDKPFVVEIPGFPGYLSSRYTTELLDWRDRSIFLLNKEDITKVSIQYPGEGLNSFVAVKGKDGKYTVDADPGISANNEVNQRRVDLLFTFFQRIYCEGYVNGATDLAQIIDTVPKRAIIDVTTTKGETKHLDIYYMPKNRRSKNLTKEEDIPYAFDIDKAYGILNNSKDTMMIQYQAFDKIFRKAYELFEKDKVPMGSN